MGGRFRVLVLSQTQVGLPLETKTQFNLGDNGAEPLKHYLSRRWPGRPARVLVADGGEQFRPEPYTPTMGTRWRKTLVAARASRLLPDADYTLAAPRPDGEEILYAGLNDPGGLKSLLALLEQSRVPLAGIHTPAWVLARAARNLCSDACLVMSEHRSRLRQVLLVAGQPRYSRMVTLPPTADKAWYADTCLQAARQLHARFQDLPTPLAIVLYAPGETSSAVAAQLRTAPEVRWLTMPPCADCDRMMALLLSAYRDHPDYARRIHTVAYRRLRLARGACAAGLACGLLGLATGAWLHVDSRMLRARAESLHAQLVLAEEELSAAGESMHPAAEAMRHAVDTAANLGPATAAPLPLLRALGAALLREPSLRLEQLQWHNDPQESYLLLRVSAVTVQPSSALWTVDRLAAAIRTAGPAVSILDAPLEAQRDAAGDVGRLYFRMRVSAATGMGRTAEPRASR